MRFHIHVLWARQSTTIPAICYSVCNIAYLDAQASGRTPNLCTPDGVFLKTYKQCIECANQQDANGTTVAWVTEAFAQFLDYCDAVAAITALSIPSSWLTFVTLTITTDLTNLNGNTITTTLNEISTVYRPGLASSQSQAMPAPTASLPPTPAASSSQNQGWIAGPVLGSIAGGALLCVGCAVLYRYRHRHRYRAGEGTHLELEGDGTRWEKPADQPLIQLHETPAVYHELDAAQRHEIPANEVTEPPTNDANVFHSHQSK